MARSTVANNIGNDIPRRTLAANFLTCSPVLHNILQARAVTRCTGEISRECMHSNARAYA